MRKKRRLFRAMAGKANVKRAILSSVIYVKSPDQRNVSTGRLSCQAPDELDEFGRPGG